MTSEPTTQTVAEFYKSNREGLLQNIASGYDGKKLWLGIRFASNYVTDRYMTQKVDVVEEELDESLKHMWFETIEAAKLFDANLFDADDDLEQWRLVAIIAGAKARGPLTRTVSHERPNEQTTETYTTSGKTVWTDMPFFDAALLEAWAKGPPTISPKAWRNLNAFASKLTSVGACDLSVLGLRTIREALETPRPLTAPPNSEATSENGDNSEFNVGVLSPSALSTVEDLLPAALAWFTHSSHIIRERVRHANPASSSSPRDDDNDLKPGQLALEASVDASGFTLKRYRFWRERLEELSATRDSGGERTELAQLALQGYTWVHSWRVGVGHVVIREEDNYEVVVAP